MRRQTYRELELFRSMDKNRDGSIDLDEFQAGLRSMGIELSRGEHHHRIHSETDHFNTIDC